MSGWKDILIEREPEVYEQMWEENEYNLQTDFPDEPPDFYAIEKKFGTDRACEINTEVERRIMDGFADAADNLRKQAKEER
jgi:hypothetical protein